jgi:nitric oxide reductase NorD protein
MPRWLNRLLPDRSDPVETRHAPSVRLPFSAVEGSLTLYVTALSGGTLRITTSAGANSGSYSDGRTIYVPAEITGFADEGSARRLYRVMAAWKVLQVERGGLEIGRLIAGENPGPVLTLYETLHGEWLDRLMFRHWPGLAHDLALLRADALQHRLPTGDDESRPAERLLRHLLALPLAARTDEREILETTGVGLPVIEAALAADDIAPVRDLATARAASIVTLTSTESTAAPLAVHYRGRIRYDLIRDLTPLRDDDEPAEENQLPPPRAKSRHDPIVVDVRAPEQMRLRERANTRGGRQSVQLSIGAREPTMTFQQVPLSDAEKQGALLYDEWDFRINRYQPEWTAVRLRHPRGGSTDAVDRIIRQNSALITRLKQQFEALRPERVRLTRQLDGDDLDLDALVNARADRRAGYAQDEKIYSRTLERERNIALGVLVDLSGSTGAWIDDDPRNDQVIEVTRRALVFLCEALTMLDDRYAIYGFTSGTRKRVDIPVIKGFDEQYSQLVKGRIAGLAPGSYTRIGPAVRHVAHVLRQQPARVRLLLLVSDGRPNDFDGYAGRYGIEDTRKALIDARQHGVSTFALTIDAEARDYMPYMFGRSHYVVVEDVRTLAIKLADIYRRLTVQ